MITGINVERIHHYADNSFRCCDHNHCCRPSDFLATIKEFKDNGERVVTIQGFCKNHISKISRALHDDKI